MYGVDNLKVRWKIAHEVGPGWLYVPFSFETDADLDMQVFRGDAFSVPDWVEVDLGDFEHDYYFEARGNRTLEIEGNISFRFTKEDLEAEKLKYPEDVEVDDVKVSLKYDPEDEYYPE